MSLTSTSGLGRDTDGLTDLARRAFDWWLDELRAMLPTSLLARATKAREVDVEVFVSRSGELRMAGRGGTPEVVAPDQIATHLARLGLAKGAARNSLAFRLDVPMSACLVRMSSLPKRNLRDARKVLLMELTDATPLHEPDIYSDWYVEGEDPETGALVLKHVILAKDRISGLVTAFEAAGVRLASITVGRGEDRSSPVDLFTSGELSFRGYLQVMPLRSKIIWGLAALLCLALPFSLSARLDRTLVEVQKERATLMATVSKLPVSDEASLVAMARMSGSPPTSQILDALAGHLPPASYLTTLRLAGDRIELHLGSGTAKSVAEKLQEAGFGMADLSMDANAMSLVFSLRSANEEGRR